MMMRANIPMPMSEPSTSAGGSQLVDPINQVSDGATNIIVLDEGVFRCPGTAGSPQQIMRKDMTSSGPEKVISIPVEVTTAEAVFELRRRSGLTWEHLSEIFNVSRRTVQRWANGMPPSAQQKREIRLTLSAVRHLDEGDSHATRGRLLSVANGQSPFELLSMGRYTEVLLRNSGAATTDVSHHQTPLSDDEWAKRQPTPPVLLLDAIQDRPKTPVGKVRIARPVRIKSPTE